jgi:hypothetical protein
LKSEKGFPMASSVSPHLVPIQLGSVRCKCYEPELDPRLADLLSPEELQAMHRFHDERVAQLPWWGSVALWCLPLCVVGLVILLVLLPQKLMVWLAFPVMGALLVVATLIDGAITECHRQKKSIGRHRGVARAEPRVEEAAGLSAALLQAEEWPCFRR